MTQFKDDLPTTQHGNINFLKWEMPKKPNNALRAGIAFKQTETKIVTC